MFVTIGGLVLSMLVMHTDRFFGHIRYRQEVREVEPKHTNLNETTAVIVMKNTSKYRHGKS